MTNTPPPPSPFGKATLSSSSTMQYLSGHHHGPIVGERAQPFQGCTDWSSGRSESLAAAQPRGPAYSGPGQISFVAATELSQVGGAGVAQRGGSNPVMMDARQVARDIHRHSGASDFGIDMIAASFHHNIACHPSVPSPTACDHLPNGSKRPRAATIVSDCHAATSKADTIARFRYSHWLSHTTSGPPARHRGGTTTTEDAEEVALVATLRYDRPLTLSEPLKTDVVVGLDPLKLGLLHFVVLPTAASARTVGQLAHRTIQEAEALAGDLLKVGVALADQYQTVPAAAELLTALGGRLDPVVVATAAAMPQVGGLISESSSADGGATERLVSSSRTARRWDAPSEIDELRRVFGASGRVAFRMGFLLIPLSGAMDALALHVISADLVYCRSLAAWNALTNGMTPRAEGGGSLRAATSSSGGASDIASYFVHSSDLLNLVRAGQIPSAASIVAAMRRMRRDPPRCLLCGKTQSSGSVEAAMAHWHTRCLKAVLGSGGRHV